MGRTYQSAVIPAAADEVWARLRDFHDMSWAQGVITSCTPIGEQKGSEIGARRKLNDVFEETLIDLNDDLRMLRYTIDDGPSPVARGEVDGYVGAIRVHPVTEGEGAFVEWSSEWVRNDDAVHDFCHPIYVSLLGELRRSFGS